MSLIALASVDPEKLSSALGAVTIMFIQLGVFMAAFMKLVSGMNGVTSGPKGLTEKLTGIVGGLLGIGGGGGDKLGTAAKAMILLAASLLVLSAAVRVLANLDWEGLAKGLAGVGGLMLELVAFLKLADFDGLGVRAGVGLLAMAAAIKILTSAVASMGGLDWTEIGKGLAGIGGLLLEITAFTRLVGKSGNLVGIGVGMTVVGASMLIFSKAIETMGALDWTTFGKGLLFIGSSLLVVGAAVQLMPASMPLIGTGLVIFSAALLVLKNAVENMGQMTWEEIAKGLLTLSISLTAITVAVNFMSGALPGAAAMLVISAALSSLASTLLRLGGMNVGEIITALLTLAGALGILAAAGALMTPFVPTLLGLGGAIALIGVSVFAAGAGLTLLAVALTAVSAGATGAAAALGAAITIIVVDLIGLIPTVLEAIGRGLIKLIDVLGDGAQSIGEAVVKIGMAILNALEALIPKIILVAAELIVALLSGIAEGLPAIVQAAFDLILAFINAIAEAIRFNDEGLFAALRNLVAAILELLLSALQALVQGIPGFGKQMSDALEGAKESVHKVLAPESFYQMGSEASDAVGKGFYSSSGTFEKAAGDMADRGLEKLSEKRGGFFSSGGKFGEDLSSGLLSMEGLVGTSADSLSDTALAHLVSVGSYGTVGTENIEEYVSGMMSQSDNAAAAGETLNDRILQELERKKQQYTGSGTINVSNFNKAITDGSEGAKTAGEKLARGGVQGVQSKSTEYRTAGENAGAGFVGGLGDSKKSIVQKASELASAALSALRNGLKEASPSKETGKSGKNFVLGFSNSLERYSYLAESASSDLAETSLLALAEPLSHLDELTDTLDTSPTITPVLDLSEVASGAGEIGQILGTDQSFKMAAETSRIMNGYTVGDTLEVRTDNTDVVGAIDRLHGDISSLNERLNRMQIVLDSGALVGQLTAPMDAAFGTRAMRSWRERGQ